MPTKKTILIVEDETALLQLLTDQLSEAGFQVLQAPNGKVGLEMALENKPDLILLDLVMPVMDGMEMCSELRKDKWGKDANVIILTNLSDAEKASDAVKMDAYDYLVKADWKLEDVVQKIKDKLNI